MADTFTLAKNDFKLVPQGEDVALKITEAVAKPKANPTLIEVVYTHGNGATLKNTYDLKKDGGLIAFSILARCILGNEVDDFSISKDLPKFINKTIECEVAHTDPNDSDKGYVYANIKKTKRVIDLEDTSNEVVATTSNEEDDDL